jgi:nitrogen fixation NifU-like protein
MRLVGTPAANQHAAVLFQNPGYHLSHDLSMSPELIDHFRNPRNVGELPPPALVVEVSNPVCGDILRLTARIENGRVAEVRYKVRGCAASIAAGSALTELMSGCDRKGLKAIGKEDVERAVGGLSNESKHAAALCRDALTAVVAKFSE